jgi:hypothetical protein
VTPPSPVRDGPGFHPRKIALGMRRPQQGKRHPWASPSPSLSLRAHSTASSRNPRDTTSCLHHHRCPVVPHNDEEYGACRHQHHPTLAQATRQTRGGPAAVIPTDCASLSAHQRLVCSWGIRLVGCGRRDLEITFRILLHVELRLDLCFCMFHVKVRWLLYVAHGGSLGWCPRSSGSEFGPMRDNHVFVSRHIPYHLF